MSNGSNQRKIRNDGHLVVTFGEFAFHGPQEELLSAVRVDLDDVVALFGENQIGQGSVELDLGSDGSGTGLADNATKAPCRTVSLRPFFIDMDLKQNKLIVTFRIKTTHAGTGKDRPVFFETSRHIKVRILTKTCEESR